MYLLYHTYVCVISVIISLFGRLENISEVHSKMKSFQVDMNICWETACVQLLKMASLMSPVVQQPEIGVEVLFCNIWIDMLPKTSNLDGFSCRCSQHQIL